MLSADGGGSVTATSHTNQVDHGLSAQIASQVATQVTPQSEAQRVTSQTDDRAKAQAFATAYNAAPADQREALVREVFAKDPEALNGWLNPESVNTLVKDGWLTDNERSGLAEAVALGFNKGAIPVEPGQAAYSITTSLAFDQIPVQNAGLAPHQEVDGLPAAYQYADNINQFLEFFGSSPSPEVAQFRQNYANHLIDTYVENPKQQNYDVRDAAAHFATQILADRAAPRELASQVLFDRYGANPDGFRAFAQYAAQGGLYTSEAYLQNITEMWGGDEQASRYAIDDPVIALAQAADGYRGNVPTHLVPPLATEASDWLATELTGLVANPPELSNTHESLATTERTQAITSAFITHSDAVLDRFTNPDVESEHYRDTDMNQWQYNLDTFSGFLQRTMFASDVIGGAAVRDKVLDYIGDQRAIVESGANPGNLSEQRIALLSATTVEAVRNIQSDIAAEKAEREELIGFTVDLALTALPLPSKANDAVTGALGQLFGAGPIGTAVKDFSGQLVDAGTGRLTDEAKAWLTEHATPSEAQLLDAYTAQDGLTAATVTLYEQQSRNPAIGPELADDYQDIVSAYNIYNNWADTR
ncbi:hypothetical protein [Caulobacter rhizosphaerae]|jgi:hypothetical protein|uniref:hypothetical protein n=1 Tax=Caulobacter rhizosphaerae TaxID=2010972 RepID=UPI0013D66844|nr:hypothetical protein [Caulobacter rhizosphaerae]GGL11611.1 hypothetical protein GCM10010983_06070 [Caulobacter rhizosphaerae]